jgi:hypothetical protein
MLRLRQPLRVGLVAVFWMVIMVPDGKAQVAPQRTLPNGYLAGSVTAQQARLVHNPKPTAGLPKYALTDQSGTIQRYVEPVDGIQLEPYIDQVVVVRHDTGRTLLASQLELPDNPAIAPGSQRITFPLDTVATQPDSFIKQLGYEEEVEPTSAVTGNRPDWVAEELPADVDPVYIDEPGQDSYMGRQCSGSCDGGCDGCSYRYRDRGLLAGIFDYGCRPEGCAPGTRGRYYLRGEYLGWRFDGMDTPPLVVTANPDGGALPPEEEPPIPAVGYDQTLFGGSQLLHKYRSGSRVTFGWFLDPCGVWALEGDYLTFGSTAENFLAGPDTVSGSEYLGRPFFAIPPGVGSESIDRIQGVVVPDQITGTVAVGVNSQFVSSGLRLIHNLCCIEIGRPGCYDCVGCDGSMGGCGGRGPCRRSGYGTRRINMAFGLRYADLHEQIAVREDLETEPSPDTTFLVNDSFITDNDFLGPEIGFNWEWIYRRWKIDLLSKLAIGNTRHRVTIDGSTSINGTLQESVGGLLAQSTNIGTYENDQLSVLPELGLRVSYKLAENLDFNIGYTFLYWSNIVRPGDQIDLDVDPKLISGDFPLTPNSGRPRVLFEETDFWAQGVSLGLEYRR